MLRQYFDRHRRDGGLATLKSRLLFVLAFDGFVVCAIVTAWAASHGLETSGKWLGSSGVLLGLAGAFQLEVSG